jgi:CHAT domain-containing protein/tetratricopeptide (TPR) repeat protein
MSSQSTAPERLFERLLAIPDETGRLSFLWRQKMLARATVEQMDAAVSALVRVDLRKARSLAETAVALANQLDDQASRAYALRALGNSLSFAGDNRRALELHTQAIDLFRQVANAVELGRALSTSIQSLILLGMYGRALATADEARKIFSECDDTLRLARLDINVGNIYHRQDRFREALNCYRRAVSQLFPDRDDEGTMAALHNIAVCLIMLHEHEEAEHTYQQLRNLCSSRNVPLAKAQAEYNIAYLYYLRGSYGRAIEMLRVARDLSVATGDPYHAALCQLDLSEIYLELNVYHDAAELAQSAYKDFQQLGMGYEAAKALCQAGIAMSQQGKGYRALQYFDDARAIFVQEENQAWPSLVDLYRALTYFNEGHIREARSYCMAALDFFDRALLPDRAILCHLLLARLSLKAGEPEAARPECEAALKGLTGRDTHVLSYQAHLVMGQVEEAASNLVAAKNHYRTAKESIEMLRSGLHGEELKISFLRNRLEVYENLVDLSLTPGATSEDLAEAWTCMEQSKSRCLLERTARRVDPAVSSKTKDTGTTLRIVNLREQLNWYYHRIEVEQLAQAPARGERLVELRRHAEQCEKEFLRAVRNLPAEEAEAAGLETPKPVSLDTIRKSLAHDTTLVEFFRVRDRLLAAVVARDGVKIVPVGDAERAADIWRALQFQLSKCHLGGEYVRRFEDQLLEVTQLRLRELYEELLAPIRSSLRGHRLIVAPHEFLHQVPFHALFDGEQYLVDSFTVSYTPSASIYMQCCQKQTNNSGSSLILGVPDPQTPSIYGELQQVATILPEAKVFLGGNATARVLRESGPQSRLIHIATHGVFRRDNPTFSGIRLGDAFLMLYDLYRLKLPVEQITLSGCSTGLNAVAAGDEVIGLARGLLYAGARALLLTLWDVNDKSTAEFMTAFYERFFKFPDRTLALQGAMRELRQRYSHPYFWAPFVLVGDTSAGPRIQDSPDPK